MGVNFPSINLLIRAILKGIAGEIDEKEISL